MEDEHKKHKNISLNENSLEENIQKLVDDFRIIGTGRRGYVEKQLSSFILKLCIQIENLRGKISGSSKIYFKTESELFLVLNEFPILGENKNERSQIKNIQSSLSLSEAIFYITDKEKDNANWITNGSEHLTITPEGSIFCKLKG